MNILFLCWALGVTLLFMVPEGRAGTITFPEMSGWDQPEKPQLYSPETLYECIDGAADLYLSYEFQELSVAEYANVQKASVTVEIYRHATPTQAFGIYSQERLADAKLLDIGAEGYQEPTVLNFVTGAYYVKINGYETGAEDERTLLAFGRKMEEVLGGKPPSPISSPPFRGKDSSSIRRNSFPRTSWGTRFSIPDLPPTTSSRGRRSRFSSSRAEIGTTAGA